MSKTTIGLCLALFAAHLQAQEAVETTDGAISTAKDVPEYRDPLADLEIDPNASQYQFERSSLRALNVQDPIEGFNRRIYRFNGQFDDLIYLPAIRTYEWATPAFVRTGVSNVFSNLADVPNLGNSILQGKVQRSMRTTARLLFNTTLGVVGVFDVAKAMGLPQESEDFGQTLGVYGIPPGPYLVLPFLGPSSLRDATGRAVDWSIEDAAAYLNNRQIMNNNPWSYGLYAIDIRYKNGFRYGTLDSPFEYDQVRYLYTKLREFQISQ